MNEPFNSQAPHFLTRVKAYCAKVLPLVFDNSLSYYEFLGKVCHKLNECIDALNVQNLNIIEFTHMVQLEMENFEKYIDTRMTDFENGIKTEWAQYKEEINQAFNDFKTQIETEWAAEKAINEKFRNDLLNDFNTFKNEVTAEQTRFENQMKADFNTFKETVNSEIEQFEQSTNADLSAFKNTMQTQQNEFETHMVELFNNFKTTEKQARTDFESNFQQLFEQWKIDTLNALNKSINDWETDTNAALMSAIEQKIGGYVATFNGQLNQLTLDLNAEREDRRQHDETLQNQINQLTPTGSIKADTADSDGNSQLYTINPDTQARTNIFPKVNDETAAGIIKLNFEKDEQYPGLTVGNNYFFFKLTPDTTPEGVIDYANAIKIPLDNINGATNEAKVANFIAQSRLALKLVCDGDDLNTCISAMPYIAMYAIHQDGTHIRVSLKLKMSSALDASGRKNFFLYGSIIY